MFSFIARRLGLLIPTFFGVTLLTFALIRLIPGVSKCFFGLHGTQSIRSDAKLKERSAKSFKKWKAKQIVDQADI